MEQLVHTWMGSIVVHNECLLLLFGPNVVAVCLFVCLSVCLFVHNNDVVIRLLVSMLLYCMQHYRIGI